MKTIILLLSVVFVSCVTANTGKRDLSGINEKPAQEQTLIEDKNRPLMLVDDYEDCMIDCVESSNGHAGTCHNLCGWCTGPGCWYYSQKPTESKKPLMLADYATCMWACQNTPPRGTEGECHNDCRREE